MAVVSPTAKAQFIDAAGVPLAGGLLYTYVAGTTTPQATYTDSTSSTANSNPIILDSRGEANIWLTGATYKFVLCDSTNTEIWTVDNIAPPSTASSPVFTTNVTISDNSPGPALLITQLGAGPAIRVQDETDPDSSPFIVDSSGNVGIGIAAPGNKLDVAGGAIQISSAGGAPRTVMSADATDSIFSVNDDRNFTVKTNATTRLTVNSSASAFANNITTTGNITASTGTITAASFVGAWANIPSGTAMLFAQTAAPTGWTKSTTHDNKALRVVSGAASSGGSVAFTTAFASQSVTGTVASYTLTTADIPSHNHTATSTDSGHVHGPLDPGATPNFLTRLAGTAWLAFNSGTTYTFGQAATTASSTANITTTIGSTGGGGGHSHGFTGTAINLAVQYVDVIIATKD